MQIARFRHSTGTSLSSAYTQAQLRSNPIARSVRRERFIPEQTVAGQAAVNQSEINATQTAFGAIAGVAANIAEKVEEAEYRSQALKAVNVYQTSTAKLRATQIASPVTTEDEEGSRFIVSDNFAEQYNEHARELSESIYSNGLTNERARQYFEQERNNIDSKHISDITKGNLDARIQVAKADSLEALEGAVSKGQIHQIVDNMANTGLIRFEEAPALVKKHIQGLNFRTTLSSVHATNQQAGNTDLSNEHYFERIGNSVDAATDLLVSGSMNQSHYNTIVSAAKRAEDDRRVMVEQTQGLNMLSLSARMLKAQAEGEDMRGFIDLATSGSMANAVGVDNALAMHKAVKSMVESGAVDIDSKQNAGLIVQAYRNNQITYDDAQRSLNQDAGSLGSYHITASNALGNARMNQHNQKKQQALRLVDTLVYSKFSQMDEETGNASQEALAARKQWNTRLDFFLDGEPEGDPTAYVLNEFVRDIQIPDYVDNKKLMQSDLKGARTHLSNEFERISTKGQEGTDTDYNEAFLKIYQTSDGRSVQGVESWFKAETQILDELSALQGLLRDTAIQSRIADKEALGVLDE